MFFFGLTAPVLSTIASSGHFRCMNNTPLSLAERVLLYMRAKNYLVDTLPGQLNLVYIEGMDIYGNLNADNPDGWNDLRLLITHLDDGTPALVMAHVATTEPGRAATLSADARRRGGVARIAFGQYKAWRMGYHKQAQNGKHHPALVQAAPLPVHRDKDRDGLRTRDTVHVGMFGINQHSTRPGYRGENVGLWSEGCLVGWLWEQHMEEFIPALRLEPRYLANPGYLFRTTVLAGDEMEKWERAHWV